MNKYTLPVVNGIVRHIDFDDMVIYVTCPAEVFISSISDYWRELLKHYFEDIYNPTDIEIQLAKLSFVFLNLHEYNNYVDMVPVDIEDFYQKRKVYLEKIEGVF